MTTMTESFPHADHVDQIEQRIPVDDLDGLDSSAELPVPLDIDPTDYHEQHEIVWLTTGDPEPLQPRWASKALSSNKLLLVADIYPAGHQIRIEDVGTRESPEMQRPGTAALDIGEHVLFVYTMTADEADSTNSAVKVRIYSGTDCRNLGELIYDGHIALTRPELAIGDALDPPEATLRVPLSRSGVIDIQLFSRTTIENLSGPNEINVLLPTSARRARPCR